MDVSTGSRLLDLPPKIRNMIYTEVFAAGNPVEVALSDARAFAPSPSILLTCGQILLEAQGIHDSQTKQFWANTVFVVEAPAAKQQNQYPAQLSALVSTVGFKHLTHLKFHTQARNTPMTVQITFRQRKCAIITYNGQGLATSAMIRFRLAVNHSMMEVAQRLISRHIYFEKTVQRFGVYMEAAATHLAALRRGRAGGLSSVREGKFAKELRLCYGRVAGQSREVMGAWRKLEFEAILGVCLASL